MGLIRAMFTLTFSVCLAVSSGIYICVCVCDRVCKQDVVKLFPDLQGFVEVVMVCLGVDMCVCFFYCFCDCLLYY